MSDFLIYVALIPVYIILTYIYKLDKNPEPKKLVNKLLFAGAFGSVAITFFLSYVIKGVLGDTYELYDTAKSGMYLIVNYFVFVALVEEFSKWIVTFIISYRHKEFDEMYDAIVYAMFVSLGFAGLENILYVFSAYFSGGDGAAVSLGVLRAFLSIPGHASFGFAMGYFIGKAKRAEINKSSMASLYLILSIVVPTIMHGIFDSCLSSNKQIYMIVYYIFIIIVNVGVLYGLLAVSKKNERFQITEASAQPVQPVMNIAKCPVCGCPDVGARHCIQCGNKLRE